jgi:FdhD protein
VQDAIGSCAAPTARQGYRADQGTPVPKGVAWYEVFRSRADAGRVRCSDAVAVEEPLEIRIDGETIATTMRTPGRDAELALGFLFAEGLIAGPGDVGSVGHCGRAGDEGRGNVIDVRSAGGHRIAAERVLEGRRWAPTTSACGVCGRRTIEDLLARVPRAAPRSIGADLAARTVAELLASQPVFARTGGLHAAAVRADDGALLAAAEDVGRHNAVDKAVGSLLARGLLGRGQAAPALAVLAVSGRSSFEIVQKAAMAGIGCVASVSAPSSLAIDLAREAGIVLLGFVRGGGWNAYANADRLVDAGESTAAAPPA